MPPPENTSPKSNKDKTPAIRTMKSDIEEMFKTSKSSLIKIVGQEMTEARGTIEKKEAKKYYMLIGGCLAALALLAGGAYLLFSGETPKDVPAKLITPAPFFATETSRTVGVKIQDRAQFIRLLEDSMREREREGTVKRIIIKVQEGQNERFASMTDFFGFWRIAPPKNLLAQIEPPLMVFIYYGKDGSRLGLAAKVRDLDRAFGEMLWWESSLLRDLQPLFFNESPETILALFEDRTYRNIDWRYLKLSQNLDFGIGHAVFPARNMLILTTSKETMETVISRLFEAR